MNMRTRVCVGYGIIFLEKFLDGTTCLAAGLVGENNVMVFVDGQAVTVLEASTIWRLQQFRHVLIPTRTPRKRIKFVCMFGVAVTL